MPINIPKGFTLIELIAFIVVVGICIVTMVSVFQYAVVRMQDPLINSQLITMAQAQLDETLSRKYDENTPVGGVPACGASIVCAGIGLDAGEVITDINSLDDVDDFHGYGDIPRPGYSRSMSVVNAGADFGLATENAKLVSETVSSPQGQSMTLSVYRFNF
jgi:MSHA pilin protein MshD